MVPGEWRSLPGHDVAVGRHVPPSSHRVDDFMRYFADRDRFNYIHPFPDGNGRVSRLMSHSMAWQAGIAARGLWSISRGLARGLESRTEYEQMMDLADSPRQGDLDGRGNLSERALAQFVAWFLRVALDQVRFMSGLFDLRGMAGRLRTLVNQQKGLKQPEAAAILEDVFARGEIDRGEAPRITRMPERSARRILADLIELGLLASDTPKGPLSLRFPARFLDVLFPRLIPVA